MTEFERFKSHVRAQLDEEREAEELLRMQIEEQIQRWDIVLSQSTEAQYILDENEADQIDILCEQHRA